VNALMGFFIGIFVGGCFGTVIMGCVVSGKQADMREIIIFAAQDKTEPAKEFIKEGR